VAAEILTGRAELDHSTADLHMPQIIVSPIASDTVREQITDYYTFLQADPETALAGLAEFKANPDAYDDDAPWHQLTSRAHEVCRRHEYGDDFEDEIAVDPSYRALIQQARATGNTQALNIRRLELYLERVARVRTLGRRAIAADTEIAA